MQLLTSLVHGLSVHSILPGGWRLIIILVSQLRVSNVADNAIVQTLLGRGKTGKREMDYKSDSCRSHPPILFKM